MHYCSGKIRLKTLSQLIYHF